MMHLSLVPFLNSEAKNPATLYYSLSRCTHKKTLVTMKERFGESIRVVLGGGGGVSIGCEMKLIKSPHFCFHSISIFTSADWLVWMGHRMFGCVNYFRASTFNVLFEPARRKRFIRSEGYPSSRVSRTMTK